MSNYKECNETFENESAWDTIERMDSLHDDDNEPIQVNRDIYK
jgi:hypothetical protein